MPSNKSEDEVPTLKKNLHKQSAETFFSMRVLSILHEKLFFFTPLIPVRSIAKNEKITGNYFLHKIPGNKENAVLRTRHKKVKNSPRHNFLH
jgi:hypothetical protein